MTIKVRQQTCQLDALRLVVVHTRAFCGAEHLRAVAVVVRAQLLCHGLCVCEHAVDLVELAVDIRHQARRKVLHVVRHVQQHVACVLARLRKRLGRLLLADLCSTARSAVRPLAELHDLRDGVAALRQLLERLRNRLRAELLQPLNPCRNLLSLCCLVCHVDVFFLLSANAGAAMQKMHKFLAFKRNKGVHSLTTKEIEKRAK